MYYLPKSLFPFPPSGHCGESPTTAQLVQNQGRHGGLPRRVLEPTDVPSRLRGILLDVVAVPEEMEVILLPLEPAGWVRLMR